MAVVQDDKLQNVIAPSDAKISCADRSAENVVAMQSLFQATQHIPKRVFLFDACRNDPFENCAQPSARARGYGFGSPEADILSDTATKTIEDGKGIGVAASQSTSALVAFSTDLGALASDGTRGTHSPFAEALLAMLKSSPRKPILEVLNLTSGAVAKATAHFQVPWVVTKGGAPSMCLVGTGCETTVVLKEKELIQQSLRLARLAEQQTDAGDAVTGMLLALAGLTDQKSRDPIQNARPFHYPVHVSLNYALQKKA